MTRVGPDSTLYLSLSQGEFIAGNLSNKLDKWKSLTDNPVIHDWIANGVALPFHEQPAEFYLPNRPLSEKHTHFVDAEINNLLASGSIEVVTCKPFCVSPLGVVPKKGNKLRLVCDLRKLNSSCTAPKFVYENIDTVLELVQPEDHFISADLKNGFHHVLVRVEDRKYLGIHWRGVYYQWKVLPFGLSSSPYFFCKILKPVVQWFREQGLKIVIYVDDILLIASAGDIEIHKTVLLQCLNDLGWFIKLEKCSLVPTTKINFIGYTIDSVGTDKCPVLKVNSERIRKLTKDLKRLLSLRHCTKRQLARVAGQCVSMSKAVLPAKLLLRNTYRLLSNCSSWETDVTLDKATLLDLTWWITALKSWNGYVLKPHKQSIQLETDASATGWGSCIGNLESSGLWDKSMALRPSNFRELAAVYLAIKSFRSHLQGKAVTVLSDNITTCAYLNHLGGPVPTLTKLAQAVWALVYKLDINLRAHYYPGKLNIHADSLSRLKSKYEWKLHPKVFQHLDQVFGPHTIDRFASFQTRQLPRYNSLSFDPETEGIDALSQENWMAESNFVNPPFRLISKVLNVIEAQEATATIIAPYWPNQVWFRRLQRMAVCPPIRIPNNPDVIRFFGQCAEPLRNRKWKIYAWKICGKLSYTRLVGQFRLPSEYLCVGQAQLCPHTTNSYNTLQSFVYQETSIFRPQIQQ